MAVKKALKKKTTTAPAANDAPKVSTDTGESGTYEGYCVKCKEKNVSYEGNVAISKTGMKMAKGPCPTCGTTICRILGKASV